MSVKISLCLVFTIFGISLCDFVPTPEKKYFASVEALNWTEAKKACAKIGLELVSVLDEQEKSTLEAFLKEYNLIPADKWTGYWLAGIRYPNETIHWDTTGTEVETKVNGWLSGEPNNRYSKEHCMELKQDGKELGWNDYFCVEERRYLCQSPRKEEFQRHRLEDYNFLTQEYPSLPKFDFRRRRFYPRFPIRTPYNIRHPIV